MYTIEIDYTHGDSFRSERTERELEYKWTLDIAKENLQRMKEHYKAYSSRNGYVSCMMKKKEDELLKQIKDKPWFVAKATYGYGTGDWENHIMFKENDGTEKEYSTYTWTDYFATLHGARIVFRKENADDEDGDDVAHASGNRIHVCINTYRQTEVTVFADSKNIVLDVCNEFHKVGMIKGQNIDKETDIPERSKATITKLWDKVDSYIETIDIESKVDSTVSLENKLHSLMKE